MLSSAKETVILSACVAYLIAVALYIQSERRKGGEQFRNRVGAALADVYPPYGEWTAHDEQSLATAYPALVSAVKAYRTMISITERRGFDHAWANLQIAITPALGPAPAPERQGYAGSAPLRRQESVTSAIRALLRFAR
jgi:hypothetical protein